MWLLQIHNEQPMGCDAQLAPPGESKFNSSIGGSYMNIFMMTGKPSKLGQLAICHTTNAAS